MIQSTAEAKMPHRVTMDDRRTLIASGVMDVDSFDDAQVIAFVEGGELTVKGKDLQITRLCLETGDLSIDGRIDSLVYAEVRSKAGGFFGRLFR